MPKDLTLSKKQMSINFFSHDQRINNHNSCSCKQWIVHTIWRRRYVTIDMLKFTDVTASHVFKKRPVSSTRAKFLCDRVVNVWNVLPVADVDHVAPF